MIRFFRNKIDDNERFSISYIVMATAIVLIVGSFLVQMAMGLCPVP
jgi:hypothetical protein